ncbi:hypothetical protein HMPREF0444_1117 [Granulicatella adiacens ATCC 49175]|uniref:Uncharacterized protein n=1 Tax=Granulicatella adiacens ATCC 49175 TaxID=638301 RepID=C8NGS2_9LACT|nr:hypothetical protein HMPREF0444_1117 [Granulicatella adiacens ATCC 49175]
MLDFRDKKEVRTIGLLRESKKCPGDMKLLGKNGLNNVKTPGRKRECRGRRIPLLALCFC